VLFIHGPHLLLGKTNSSGASPEILYSDDSRINWRKPGGVAARNVEEGGRRCPRVDST